MLLLVLVVLVLAGCLLAATARRHAQRVLQATQAREQLQLRWGVRSCQALCLPAAEQVLQRSAPPGEPTPAKLCRTVTLGEMRFTMLLADEQAKANVNLLAQRGHEIDLSTALYALQARSRRARAVRLRPVTPRPDTAVITRYPMRYTHPQQVFAFGHPETILPAGELARSRGIWIESPLDHVTCWGSGRVNVHRASREVLRVVLAGVLDETKLDELIAFRQARPDATLTEAMAALELDKDQRKDFQDRATDLSQCHSLWVIAHGPRRSWYRLRVTQQADAENDAQWWSFSW